MDLGFAGEHRQAGGEVRRKVQALGSEVSAIQQRLQSVLVDFAKVKHYLHRILPKPVDYPVHDYSQDLD